jgi:hypothetical protein
MNMSYVFNGLEIPRAENLSNGQKFTARSIKMRRLALPIGRRMAVF